MNATLTCQEHPNDALEYTKKWDAYYCKKCNAWIEEKCYEPSCRFCNERPEKPLKTKKDRPSV